MVRQYYHLAIVDFETGDVDVANIWTANGSLGNCLLARNLGFQNKHVPHNLDFCRTLVLAQLPRNTSSGLDLVFKSLFL